MSLNAPRLRQVGLQLLSFALVGGLGFVVDVVVFNALRTTVFAPEVVPGGPILAKVVSTAFAILVNWLGNRHWTFRSQRRRDWAREGVEFVLVSIAGSLIGLACLGISHYVLGMRTILADNISGNVIGLILGSAFRFVFYRYWVFREDREPSAARRLRHEEDPLVERPKPAEAEA